MAVGTFAHFNNNPDSITVIKRTSLGTSGATIAAGKYARVHYSMYVSWVTPGGEEFVDSISGDVFVPTGTLVEVRVVTAPGSGGPYAWLQLDSAPAAGTGLSNAVVSPTSTLLSVTGHVIIQEYLE